MSIFSKILIVPIYRCGFFFRICTILVQNCFDLGLAYAEAMANFQEQVKISSHVFDIGNVSATTYIYTCLILFFTPSLLIISYFLIGHCLVTTNHMKVSWLYKTQYHCASVAQYHFQHLIIYLLESILCFSHYHVHTLVFYSLYSRKCLSFFSDSTGSPISNKLLSNTFTIL